MAFNPQIYENFLIKYKKQRKVLFFSINDGFCFVKNVYFCGSFKFLGIVRLFSSLFFLFLSISLYSANLLGTVVDKEDNGVLPYATVELLSVSDSSMVKGEVCDAEGAFSINNVEEGNYLLRTSFMGYITSYRKVMVKEVDAKPLRVRMVADKVMLDEVKILAAATPVVVKEDTLVYNADAFRVADGAMLEDLVKKLPGAQLSKDGKLVVNGKEIKKILVDGRDFFSDNPQMSLKNLPANMVENIKTYDKKSDASQLTGVDDDDDEAVLDLTVKKGMKKGWMGQLYGGAGHDLYESNPDIRYGLGANISRFKDNQNFSFIGSMNNVNNSGFTDESSAGGQRGNGNGITTSDVVGITFAKDKSKQYEYGGNVQYKHTKNDIEKTSKKETFRTSGTTYRNDHERSQKKGDDVSTNFRFKWAPDSMTTILFRPGLSYAHANTNTETETQNYNTSRVMNNEKNILKTLESDRLLFNSSLRLVRKLNKAGRNLSFNTGMTYGYSPSNQNSWSDTRFYTQEEENEVDSILQTNRYTDKNSSNLTYYVEASYTEPVFKKHFLQFKYRYQHRNSNSYSYVYEEDHTNYIDSLSSKVENGYNNHQIDVSLQGRYPKVTYNVGMTLQPQSSSTVNLVGPNVGKDKRQSVFNFSPNLRLRVKFDKQCNLKFMYRGQSAAPDVEYLQEVIDETDPLNLEYGNPDLKPTYTHNASLRFKKYTSELQRSWMANLTYRMVQNAIMNRLLYDARTGVQKSYKENVNGNWNIGSSLTFSTPFKNKDFSFSTDTRGSYAEHVSLESTRGEETSTPKSTTRAMGIDERISFDCKKEKFDISLYGEIDYQKNKNERQMAGNYETVDYEIGVNTNVNLPWNMAISTDIEYHIYSGYSDGFDEQEVLWNAQVSKSFLKNNAATIRFKVYDLLGQQSNLSRKISDSSITDVECSTLGSYFLLQFSYKLNNFQQRERKVRKEF